MLIAFFLAVSIVFTPWESIRNYEFVDLSRNIEKFNYPQYYFETYGDLTTIKSLISDEPLWYHINVLSKNIGISGGFLFGFIAFFGIFTLNYYVLKKVSSPLYLLLFINPVFLYFSLTNLEAILKSVLL